MLKRLLLSLTILSLTQGAHASPETAEKWGAQASALYQTTAELLRAVKAGTATELDHEYLTKLAQFSTVAGRLAVWVDTSDGAKDFGCIYRGMAEEAELQLYTLEDANNKASAKTALTRIATMLDDAQSIAIASAHAARTGNSAVQTSHCPASSIVLDQYFAEHP